jgi:hypothetical protein
MITCISFCNDKFRCIIIKLTKILKIRREIQNLINIQNIFVVNRKRISCLNYWYVHTKEQNSMFAKKWKVGRNFENVSKKCCS